MQRHYTPIHLHCLWCGKVFRLKHRNAERYFCGYRCKVNLDNARRHVPVEERFWTRVEKDGPVLTHVAHLGPCWIWVGTRNRYGYGTFSKTPASPVYAHRLAWE